MSKQTDRIAELIRRKLAQLVLNEVRDPRLPKLVSITAVKLSSDLSFARVYFTVLHEEALVATTILNAASHFLRKALSQCIPFRTVPKLVFVYDDSMESGRKLTKLLEEEEIRANPVDDASSREHE